MLLVTSFLLFLFAFLRNDDTEALQNLPESMFDVESIIYTTDEDNLRQMSSTVTWITQRISES